MDDATAYMALALNNAQGELSPLEVGLHSLHSGLSKRDMPSVSGYRSLTMTADTYSHLFPRGDDAAEVAAAERDLLG